METKYHKEFRTGFFETFLTYNYDYINISGNTIKIAKFIEDSFKEVNDSDNYFESGKAYGILLSQKMDRPVRNKASEELWNLYKNGIK